MFFKIGLFLHCFVTVRLVKGYTILHLNIDEGNDKNVRSPDDDLLNRQLIDELIDIVKKQDGVTNMGIHNCLDDHQTKLNKLKCIKNIVENRKATTRSWYNSELDYFSDIFNDDLKDIETTTQRSFLDLTRSTEISDNRPLDNNFAEDYIDFFGLSRSGDTTPKGNKQAFKNHKNDLNGRRMTDFVLKKILRTNDYDDSNDSGSDSDGSSRKKKYSQDSNSDESVEIKRKPKKFARKDPFKYMQSPTRVYEIDLDRRRRLPHFLPKRYHWDEEDFKDLRNYWIHGRQGKYPGPYKIPY